MAASMSQEDIPASDSHVPAHSYKAAEKELKDICEELWLNINKVHNELNQISTAETPEDDPVMKISQVEERQLRAEIKVLKERTPEVLPQNPNILHDILKEELTQSVQQLQHTLLALRSQQQELEASIEREKELLDQHKQMKAALEEKIVKSVNQQINISESGHWTWYGHEKCNCCKSRSTFSYKKELDEKMNKAKSHRRQLMKQLASFVADHYHAPTEVESRKWHYKRYRSTNDPIEADGFLPFLPLQTMLESLMNKVVETPHDPYIILNEQHWPPYIELLLRCGIALKHPEDDRKIKLTPFHY